MAITTYQVQSILKIYARQLSHGQKMVRAKVQKAQAFHMGANIEARRRLIVEKITAEIINGLGIPGFGTGLDDIELLAMQQLSQEYGQTLLLSKDEFSGSFRFQVKSTSGVLRELDIQTSSELENRLYQITQDIVEHNML